MPVSRGISVERWSRVVGSRRNSGHSKLLVRRSLFRLRVAFHDLPESLKAHNLVFREKTPSEMMSVLSRENYINSPVSAHSLHFGYRPKISLLIIVVYLARLP